MMPTTHNRHTRVVQRELNPVRRATRWIAIGLLTCSAIAPAAGQALTQASDPLAQYDQAKLQEALERARTYDAVKYPDNSPPDGHWFESDDGHFYVSRVSKTLSRGLFRISDAGMVRMSFGLLLPLVDETEEDIFVLRPKAKPSKRVVGRKRPTKEVTPNPNPRGDESLVEPLRLEIATSSFDQGLPTSARWRNNVVAADVNGDGHPDLVHGPPRKATARPHFFLGDGQGNWQGASLRFQGGRLDYGDIAVADFDADGNLDIALAMHLLGTTVGYGRGQFVFQERSDGFDRPDWARPDSRFGKRAPWSSRALSAIDLDLDGDLDLVAIGEGAESMSLMRTENAGERVKSPGLTVYVNNGAKSWSAVRFTDLPAGGDRVAMGNFDADPEPEAVVAWAQADAKNVLVDFDWSNPELPTVNATIPEALDEQVRTTISAVAAGDVLPGGADEIIVGRLLYQGDDGWQGRIEVLSRADGKLDGEWHAHTLAAWQSNERINDIEVGDLDGDGHLDIVAATAASRIHVMRNSGNGTFYLSNESIVAEQYNCNAFSLEVADLNGDGKAEIASGFAGEQLNIPGIQTIPGCENDGRLSVWQIASMEAVPSRSGEGARLPIVVHEYRTAPLSPEEKALQLLKDTKEKPGQD